MREKRFGWMGFAGTAVLTLAVAACGRGDAEAGQAGQAEEMAADGEAADVVVYKTAACGCCAGWADHMRENGFSVREVDLGANELSEKKVELGVPYDLASCHTARVDDYVVEGHVPADAVRRLLEERPNVEGIAVRGMPIGSPGMEGPNPQPYDVIAFDGEERTIFETVEPSSPGAP